jgi:hypothetical protein
MGKAIYCQTCGKSLREEDFDRGRAFRQENSNFCADCRPELAATAPREPTPPSTARRPALRPPDAEKPGSTAKLPKVQGQDTPERRKPLLWISAVVVAVVVVLAVIVVSTVGDIRETPPPFVAPPPPPPIPPKPKPLEPTPVERDFLALRRLLAEPVKGWNTGEIDSLLRTLATSAGPRREELDALRAEYERGLRTLNLRDGLLARWSLDDADGAVAHDSGGGGRDAKIVGTPVRVPGRVGGAFQFNGPDCYLEIPARGILDVRTNACFTLAAWFMPESLPPATGPLNDAYYGIVMRAGFPIGLDVTRSGQTEFRFCTADKKSVLALSADRMPPKVWTHVAGVVDSKAGRVTVFINGRHSGESAYPPKSGILPSDSLWRIGIGEPKSKESRWGARGAIDEVLFYARALAPEEIALLAEGVVPPEADPRRQEPGDAGLVFHLSAERGLKSEGTEALSWSDEAHGVEAAATAVRDERPTLASVDGRPCLKFDGKNDRLLIPSQPSMNFDEKDSFTLALRVQLPAVVKNRWQGVIEKNLDAGSWYGIWIDNQNRWVFGGPQNLHGNPVHPGESVVVAVQDGGRERRLYVNGHRVATGPAWPGTGSGPFWFGGSPRPEFFEGQILDVRLWRRALDAAEVRGLNR